jgi:very-short-patch-repair endonuclease
MDEARRRSTVKQWRNLGPEARRMRKQSTPAEDALWQALRGRRIAGAKFRRQHAVGPFIVDFICLEHHLVVEVDGDIHLAQQGRDRERDAYLRAGGLDIVRVTNDDVLNRLETVVQRIVTRLSDAGS